MMPTGCSRPSSPPSPAAWAWGSQSADRSWRPTEDVCQLPATRGPVLHFNSSCPSIRRTRHDRAPKKCEAEVRDIARRQIPVLAVGVLAFLVLVFAYALAEHLPILHRWIDRPYLFVFPVTGAV